MRKWLLLAVFILVIGFTLYNGQTTQPLSAEQKPEVGFLAPDFSLEELHTAEQLVLKDVKKPLILNFWASWCGPCRLEAADFAHSYTEFKDKVEIFAINVTNQDELRDVEAFIQEFNLEMPILLDRDGSVGELYRVISMPTTFFIDSEGVIVHRKNGYISKVELEQNIRKLVGR